MKIRGVIIRFKKSDKWGTIQYGGHFEGSQLILPRITFFVSDIIGYQDQKINVGQEVEFEIRNVKGRKEVVNLTLIDEFPIENPFLNNKNQKSSPSKILEIHKDLKSKERRLKGQRLNEIIKYNYENWEEIEKIIDGVYESEKIDLKESASLDFTYNNVLKETANRNFIALAAFDNKIKLVSLTKDFRCSFLDEAKKYHNILYPSFIQEAALELAIEEFEDLINSLKSKEEDFQNFFERNPDFILSKEYKKAHPHVILAKEDKKRLIPDFVLEPVNQTEFCDLLELKLPSSKIYVMKRNREHFSAAITEVIAQLRVYSNFFNEEQNRNNFQQRYPELKVYKPKMFVIIGRQGNEPPMIKREIQAEHPGLILRNYDDLLTYMKWKKQKLEDKNKMYR